MRRDDQKNLPWHFRFGMTFTIPSCVDGARRSKDFLPEVQNQLSPGVGYRRERPARA